MNGMLQFITVLGILMHAIIAMHRDYRVIRLIGNRLLIFINLTYQHCLIRFHFNVSRGRESFTPRLTLLDSSNENGNCSRMIWKLDRL